MAVVGAVEVVLSARDTMSPTLVEAATSVKTLRDQLALMGAEAGPAFTQMQAAVAAAEARFDSLLVKQAAATQSMVALGVESSAASTKITEVGTSAGTSTVQLTQMEGIATRMIERLAILYAIRGTFNFIKDVIDTNSQLVEFEKQSGRSLESLQLLQFEASQTGVPFEKVTSSIDRMNKILGESKEMTSVLLGSMGIDVDRFFTMSPDDKWNALSKAIAGIEDPMKRAAMEAKFGIEALDPLITSASDLEKKFADMPRTTDAEAEALNRLAHAFVGLWDAIKGGAGKEIGDAMIGLEALLYGRVPGMSGTDPSLTGLGRALLGPTRGKGLDLFPGLTAALGGGHSIDSSDGTGRDINLDKGSSSADGPKDQDIRQMMEDAKKLSEEMIAWQKRYDAALEKHIEIVDGANSADSRWQETLKNIQGRTPPFEAEYLTSQQVIDRAKSDLRGGMSAGNVAAELDLYPEQVKAIQAELRDEAATLKMLTTSVNMATEQHVIAIEKLGTTYQNLNGIRTAVLSTESLLSYPVVASGGKLPSQQGILGLPAGFADQAAADMQAAKYGFADEFKDLPKILEEAFSRSGSVGKALSTIATRTGQDFARDMSLNIGAGLGFGVDVIGQGIMAGVALAGSGKSRSGQILGSISEGIGAGTAAAEAGATLGASFATGFATFGISVGVELAIMGIMHIMRDRVPEDLARDAGTRFGKEWSDALTKEITARSKDILPAEFLTQEMVDQARRTGNVKPLQRGEQSAELISLADIIREHPVTADNVEMYEARAHDLFSMIATGQMSTKEAAAVLNNIFNDLAVNSTDANGRISDSFRELINLSHQYGTNVKAIADWEKAQGLSVAAGASAVAGYLPMEELNRIGDAVVAAQKAVDDFSKDPKNKGKDVPKDLQDKLAAAKSDQTGVRTGGTISPEMLGDIGSELIGGFAIARGTGSTRAEAIGSESKALTDLEKAYKDLGIEVTDVALKQLFMQNDMMQAAPTLIAGIGGLAKEMVGLDNLGQENADNFAEQERTGYAMYVRLQSAAAALGGSTKDALLPMQDYLHRAAEEAKKLNIPLDENTQMMINQSKDLGIWEENAGKAVSPTQALADAIADLVKWLKGIPPEIHTKVVVDGDVTTAGGKDVTGGTGGVTGKGGKGGIGGGIQVDPFARPGGLNVNPSFRPGMAAAQGANINISLVANGVLDANSLIPIVHDHFLPVVIKALDNNRMGVRTVMRESLRVA